MHVIEALLGAIVPVVPLMPVTAARQEIHAAMPVNGAIVPGGQTLHSFASPPSSGDATSL
jgi:hypothetical protein